MALTEQSYEQYSERWTWNATFLKCAEKFIVSLLWRVTHIWTWLMVINGGWTSGHCCYRKSQFSCKCRFIPNYFSVNGMLFWVWDSNEAIQCLRKSAHVFFPFSGWVFAWSIYSLLSNSNILDAVIGTNQVWCTVANVWPVFSFMDMFKHLLRAHAHLNLFQQLSHSHLQHHGCMLTISIKLTCVSVVL